VRALIYVPVVHSEVDLGTMAGELRRRFEETFGAAEWARRFASVETMWDGLRTMLCALPLNWSTTRLYQDGLPVCEQEREIVRDLAAKRSRNHQLLVELMERGAVLMGTERPDLLVKEYRRIQRLVQTSQEPASDASIAELRSEGQAILAERDAFIAHRIDATLKESETGILFLGLLHRVDELLDGKFEVRHLIHNLPFGADPWRQLRERRGHDE
jgi:hypothetical protein